MLSSQRLMANAESGKQSISPESNKTLPYRVPKEIASATIHFLYGVSKKRNFASINDYLKKNKYALTADLLQEGFKTTQIEEAVNSGSIKVAPVFKKRISDLYWIPEVEKELDELSIIVKAQCGGDGKDMEAPAMGDVASVGAVLESQQIALAAIAYSANKGLILETDIDRGIGIGNLFVSKDSPASIIFEGK
jgi:hypothetical protein